MAGGLLIRTRRSASHTTTRSDWLMDGLGINRCRHLGVSPEGVLTVRFTCSEPSCSPWLRGTPRRRGEDPRSSSLLAGDAPTRGPASASSLLSAIPGQWSFSQYELVERVARGADQVWGKLAQQWVEDQARVEAMRAATGALLLRFKDIVADPDAARAAIAREIGVPAADARRCAATQRCTLNASTGSVAPSSRFDAQRATRWKGSMQPRSVRVIENICAGPMGRFGYMPVSLNR